MSMSAAGLAQAIIIQMSAQGFSPLSAETDGQAVKYINALSTAIVQYIQANAEAAVSGGSSAGNHPIV